MGRLIAAVSVLAVAFAGGWFSATLTGLPTPTNDVQAAAVTAYATVALAAVGTVSIVANIWLGFVAWQTARAARDQATQESRQVDAMQRQLTLLENQRLDAKALAFPLIRVSGMRYEPQTRSFEGELEYVQGSEPARQVRLWLRYEARMYATDVETMTPRDERRRFAAPEGSLEALRPSLQPTPFADLLNEEPNTIGRLVVSWAGLDGTTGQYREELRDPTGEWTEVALGRIRAVQV